MIPVDPRILMAEARNRASALTSGSGSGESDNGVTLNTRKKPKVAGSVPEGDQARLLSVSFEGLVVTPPPDPSVVSSLPKHRHQRQETASYSPRSHKKGKLRGKRLFEANKPLQPPEWTQEEHRQLAEFLLLYTDGKTWVQHKDMRFWGAAGEFIQHCLQTLYSVY